jgi:hypothetical protein
MPRYRKCTEEDVYRILLEATARGESPTREDLAEKVAEKCDYKIGTARNLVKSSERMDFIKCSGWGRKSLCIPVKGHYDGVAMILMLIRSNKEIEIYSRPEEDVENALTHVVSRDRDSLAIARDIIRWWRKFEELRQQIYKHMLLLDNFVRNLEEKEAKVIEDELRRLNWNVNNVSLQGILDALDRMSDMVVKGELTSKQLNELEGVAPKSIGVLRVTVMVKREVPLLKKALSKLWEKVDRLYEVIGIVLHHYSKVGRIQGLCAYCTKEVPKEIRNVVKDLLHILRKLSSTAREFKALDSLEQYLEHPLISLSDPVHRFIIFKLILQPEQVNTSS